ncbi:MAG TPA: hypothetical protein VFX29_05515 [Longimicrobiaceae bacterium]|nr:hypothetical protein [Longimicrobiaceae bacterium]
MHVSNYSPNIATVRCLGGMDANRYPFTLAVQRDNGLIYDQFSIGTEFATTLEKVGESELMGWGELDGPAVEACYKGATHPFTFPRAEWEALEKWAAETAPTAASAANELRDAVSVLELCIDALEGRDGADVLTELARVQGQLRRTEAAVGVLLASESW